MKPASTFSLVDQAASFDRAGAPRNQLASMCCPSCGSETPGPNVKDGINNYLVHKRVGAVNAAGTGTKAAAHYQLGVGTGQTATLRLPLSATAPDKMPDPFAGFDQSFAARLREADDFYRAITPPEIGEDAANVMRQALAGMLWTKQYYLFEADKWLEEHGADLMLARTQQVRPAKRVFRADAALLSFFGKE